MVGQCLSVTESQYNIYKRMVGQCHSVSVSQSHSGRIRKNTKWAVMLPVSDSRGFSGWLRVGSRFKILDLFPLFDLYQPSQSATDWLSDNACPDVSPDQYTEMENLILKSVAPSGSNINHCLKEV